MSGSNYGGRDSTITYTMKVNINCERCLEQILGSIRIEIQGVDEANRAGKRITIIRRVEHSLVRQLNVSLMPWEMKLVAGINIDCYGCYKNTTDVVAATPGFKCMAIDEETRLVTMEGVLCINSLARDLERKLKKKVKIITADVDLGVVFDNPCVCMNDIRLREVLHKIRTLL